MSCQTKELNTGQGKSHIVTYLSTKLKNSDTTKPDEVKRMNLTD